MINKIFESLFKGASDEELDRRGFRPLPQWMTERTFDWREKEEASAWIAQQERKGRHVYLVWTEGEEEDVYWFKVYKTALPNLPKGIIWEMGVKLVHPCDIE